MRLKSLVLMIGSLVLFSNPALAKIIHVPSDSSTIQGGINGAINGDTVLVAPGTYVENINFNGHNIIVGSLFLTTGDTSYISSTIIDGDSSGSVVTFENDEDSTATITGFTICKGLSDWGGGIYCISSNPSINYNAISGNSATAGGGICCRSSSPQISQNAVTQNAATGEYGAGGGGGIHCSVCACPVIKDNTISGNSANAGGGIYCRNSSNATISDNLISDNIATHEYGNGGGIHCRVYSNPVISGNAIIGNVADNNDGGGIGCAYSSNPIISNNNIVGNSAHLSGGGVHCWGSNPTINANTISTNYARGGGGGIGCAYCTHPTIIGNTISENETINSGGGISLYDSDPSIISNTITSNSALGGDGWGGGGFFCSYSNPTLTDNIISSNVTSQSGGGIQCFYSSPTINNNIIRDNSADLEGGALALSDCDSSVISHNNISGNSATVAGGGLFSNESYANMYNNTIAENLAESGGAIFCVFGVSLSLENCILAFNRAYDAAVFCFDTTCGVPALSCCDIYSNQGGDWVGCIADQADTNGNFSADPFFCDTANADFHIDATSLCASVNNSCGTLIGALGVGCGCIFGDANGDTDVNIIDAVYIINYLFKEGPAPDPIQGGDVNCDDVVDIKDVLYLIDYIFKSGPPPCEPEE